ncbi:MAG: hypothetical protein PVI87_09545 [Gammaproteobacteria bacterium]|jgi:hypothetical protein
MNVRITTRDGDAALRRLAEREACAAVSRAVNAYLYSLYCEGDADEADEESVSFDGWPADWQWSDDGAVECV